MPCSICQDNGNLDSLSPHFEFTYFSISQRRAHASSVSLKVIKNAIPHKAMMINMPAA
jgi:hypothetical protein